MFRTLLRRGIPALVLTLVLAGAAPAAAAQSPGGALWDGVWRWAMSFWLDGETGDRGAGLDPDGLTGGGDSGAGADPNGLTGGGDRGAGLDPNGLAGDGDRGAGADPDGSTSNGDSGAGADPNG